MEYYLIKKEARFNYLLSKYGSNNLDFDKIFISNDFNLTKEDLIKYGGFVSPYTLIYAVSKHIKRAIDCAYIIKKVFDKNTLQKHATLYPHEWVNYIDVELINYRYIKFDSLCGHSPIENDTLYYPKLTYKYYVDYLFPLIKHDINIGSSTVKKRTLSFITKHNLPVKILTHFLTNCNYTKLSAAEKKSLKKYIDDNVFKKNIESRDKKSFLELVKTIYGENDSIYETVKCRLEPLTKQCVVDYIRGVFYWAIEKIAYYSVLDKKDFDERRN